MMTVNPSAQQISNDKQQTAIFIAYDAKCKVILSRKDVLSYILKDCLEDFADVAPRQIAEKYIIGEPAVGKENVNPDISPMIGPAEDASVTEGSVFFDVKFMARTPNSDDNVDLIVNVEAQNNFNPWYWLPARGIYYVCRLISAQYGVFLVKSGYGRLVHAVSIWICMNPAREFENTVTRFSLKPEHLFGKAEYLRKSYDLITVVMVCLSDTLDKDDGVPNMIRLLRALMTGTASRNEREEYLRREFPDFPVDNMKEDMNDMTYLAQGVYDKGIAKGRTEMSFDLVSQNLLPPDIGAAQLKISGAEFSRRFDEFRKNKV